MRKPHLLPSPRTFVARSGSFPLKPDVPIVLAAGSTESDFFAARALRSAIAKRAGLHLPIETHARRDDLGPRVELLRRGDVGEAYRLHVSSELVRAEAEGEAGLFYAAETAAELVTPSATLPGCEIEDAPELPKRGVLLDISRGKVPTLATLKGFVDFMAGLKLNLLMLYTEHVFRFRRHPRIGKDASPMEAWELRELDEFAARRHVELVPTLQSLGHMHQILKHPDYRHLAESERRWSISPSLEESYALLDELYSEYLPNFRSSWFNANCDEPVDLGKGLSRSRAEKDGVAAVFASHLARVQDLAAKYGKKTMVWADVVFEHREAIPLLPKDLVLIDWWYEASHDFDRVRVFPEHGLRFMVAAGTSSWNTLFPRVENALANIHGYASAAKRHGAEGFLVTDWGDGGHGNLLGNSIYCFAFGAQQAWSGPDSDTSDFDRAFSRKLFSDPGAFAGRLYRRLGDLHRTGFDHFNHSPLKTLFFDDLTEGKYTSKAKPRVLARTLEKLTSVRKDFARSEKLLQARPEECSELGFAIEASILAARKGLAGAEYLRFRKDPASVPARERKRLGAELARIERDQKNLRRELRGLWLARNRPSSFELMDSQYAVSIRGLRRAQSALGSALGAGRGRGR